MNDELKKLRDRIDTVDDEIVSLLSKRTDIVKEVGKLKKEHQLELLDEKRLNELLDTKKQKAKLLGISESFIENIFKQIHEYSVQIQKKL